MNAWLNRGAGTAVVLAAAAMCAPAIAADAPAEGEDSAILVNGNRLPQTIMREVPGGTSVVAMEQLQGMRIATLSDALKLTPGVFAQSISGGEGTLISVRGSGLTKSGFSYGNGTQVLMDGLPITSMYGTPYESFEPNAVSRIDIYKGANAFEFGATQLGGVINFIQRTGRDADVLTLRAEGGRYGYNRQQIASGQVIGPIDYYVSLTRFATNGYLDNSDASSKRAYANLGWQMAPGLVSRVYFSLSQAHARNIGAQTRAQVYSTPCTFNLATGARDNRHSLLLGWKTTYDVDAHSSLEFDLGYKAVPLTNGNLPQLTYWDLADFSGTLRYRLHDEFAGHEFKLTAAVVTDFATKGSGARIYNNNTKATLGQVGYGGHNITALISNDFALTPKLWLLGGIAWIHQTRNVNILNQVAAGTANAITRAYSNATPRLGVRYDVTPVVSVYANFSRLIEAPQVISYTTTSAGTYTGFTTAGLKVQKGNSFELGARGNIGLVSFDVGYFREYLTDELLTVYTVLPNTDPRNPNGITATTNAAPTLKEGVEASLNAVLWRDGRSDLSLRQSYAWSNFRFRKQNLALGQGIAPRIPPHFYQADLTYHHASGIYLGMQVEAVLARYPVDYVNRTYAPSYALFGATAGYAAPGGKWRVFGQVVNLADKLYASSVSQVFSATAGSAIYIPGVGRSVTAGASFAF